jgi:glycosyltransferase involved in cell wall biosynthesis
VIIAVPSLPIDINRIKGGVHSALNNLLKGFENKNIQIRVISLTREVEKLKIIDYSPNIQIHYINEGSLPFHSLNYLFYGSRIMKKNILEFNPDIIHFEEGNTFLFNGILGLLNRKYLLTIHGMAFDEAKRKKKIIDKITWWFNGAVQKLLTPNNIIHLSEFSKKKHLTKNKENYMIIPNAVLPFFFSVPSKNKTNNRLLYIGLVDNNKNLIFLLKNLKRLIENDKTFTLEVLGDFSNNDIKILIENYISENKLEKYVNFNGWVTQTNSLIFLENADILVVSSQHESLPMVIAESMAAGKVVVSSDVGGIPEMINNNVDGFLYNLSDTNGLFNTLENLYDNSELILKISAAAKKTALSKYECENVAEKTLNFYNKCLSA